MSRYKNILVIASILLAVCLPLVSAVMAERDFSRAEIIKVEIEPYDPRDLLYGQFLQFRIKWNWKGGKANSDACTSIQGNTPFKEACCLCIEEGTNNPQTSLAKCDDVPKVCKYVIPSKAYYGGDDFPVNIDRFYVDERFAKPLENIFRAGREKFSVGLAMRKKGNPLLEKLYIGGQELSGFVAKHGNGIPNPETELPQSMPTP